MNLMVLIVGELLVLLQGILAYKDGYLTRKEMREYHDIAYTLKGFSFMQHGGMWADVLLVSPLMAYLVHVHAFAYDSWAGLAVLAGSALVIRVLGRMYAAVSLKVPEAHAHDGKTTWAGRVHGAYALPCMWLLVMYYLGPRREPGESYDDMIFTSKCLTPYFFIDAAKWSHRWMDGFLSDRFALAQSFGFPLLIWSVTLVRIHFQL